MCKECSRVLNNVLLFLKFHRRFVVNGSCGERPLKGPLAAGLGSMLTSQISDQVKGLAILYAHCCPIFMLSEPVHQGSRIRKRPLKSLKTLI